VVISASHNPYHDNGLKVFARDGFKLPDDDELELERLILGNELERMRPGPADIGKAVRIEDAVGRYVVYLKNTFPRDRTLDGVRMVVDCGNGAAYRCAPEVFTELGAHVIPLGVNPDGKNINDGAGALHTETMCNTVRKEGADLGVALDGDADRVIICDEQGKIVDGDAVMALCGTRLLKRGRLARKTLVTTVMSNLGLERAIAGAGGTVVRTAVGDRYVVEEMRRSGASFGGEQSGHLIFLEHATTGDGIIAALAVLAIMLEEQTPLSRLAEVMTRYPQVLVNIQVAARRPLDQLPAVAELIARCERDLGGDGRVLVRYSGTEPKARVMVEGPDEGRIQVWAQEIATALAAACAVSVA
jgi:phosphoglucosamine mutase